MKVTFSAQGTITQEISLIDESLTASDIQSGLNSGKYATTVQEGDTFIEEIGTGKRIASIVNVDNNLEYFDYEVDEA